MRLPKRKQSKPELNIEITKNSDYSFILPFLQVGIGIGDLCMKHLAFLGVQGIVENTIMVIENWQE
jgi:hypothetical protein